MADDNLCLGCQSTFTPQIKLQGRQQCFYQDHPGSPPSRSIHQKGSRSVLAFCFVLRFIFSLQPQHPPRLPRQIYLHEHLGSTPPLGAYTRCKEQGALDAMAFLFGKSKQKTAQDLVKNTKDMLGRLMSQEGQTAKVRIARCVRPGGVWLYRRITSENRAKRSWPSKSPT